MCPPDGDSLPGTANTFQPCSCPQMGTNSACLVSVHLGQTLCAPARP